MALVSASIPNLVNGVSQQAATQRLPSQGAEQENFLSSVAHGLVRRPPTRHISRLMPVAPADAAVHVVERDAVERYWVALLDGDLKVFDLDGVERAVSFVKDGYDSRDYLTLTAGDASNAFRIVTVADHSFVVNRERTVRLKPDRTPTRAAEALINVRLGNYGRTYRILIDGVEAANHKTPNGSVASDADAIDTTAIAEALTAQVIAAGLSGVTAVRIQNAIHITKESGDFSIAIEDGFSGQAMTVAKGKVQRFSDLPNVGPDGFQLEIVGEEVSSFDNYHVRFDKYNPANSAGVWAEAPAGGVQDSLDPATMPHQLVSIADGGFRFEPIDWTRRAVGDADGAPPPSFVDRRLNDVFFFRNRLGFLSDENVILSRAGDFFNFWRKTMTAALDSDPIDVAGAHNRVSILRHAQPFNRSLLLFADQTQFVMEGDDLLTPATASIKAVTEFSASAAAKPIGVGRQVFFAVERGAHAGVLEFYTDRLADLSDAADITAHAPRLIPAGVRRLAAADHETLLVALSRGAADQLFVYSYFWRDDEKLQSAWSTWRFGADARLISADFVGSSLYLGVARADGLHLEALDLDEASAATPPALLDRRVETGVEGRASAALVAGDTVVSLPYDEPGALMCLDKATGRALAHTRPSDGALALSGDHTGAPLVIGRRYVSRYVFSPFYVREGDGGGALGEGRLQVLYFSVIYDATGGFTLRVRPTGGDQFAYVFSGRVTGSEGNRLGAAALASGRFRAPVYARNDAVEIAIEADGALPARFLSAEWEGRLSLRSERR